MTDGSLTPEGTTRSEKRDILLIPILGLFMLLIPLLLLGIGFLEPRAMELTFPSGGSQIAVGEIPPSTIYRLEIEARRDERNRRFVGVYRENGDSLQTIEYTNTSLFQALDAAIVEPPDSMKIVAGIKIDDLLPYDDLVQILDALHKKGIDNTMIYPPENWKSKSVRP